MPASSASRSSTCSASGDLQDVTIILDASAPGTYLEF